MKKNLIKEKTFHFAINIYKFTKAVRSVNNQIIVSQLLKSGTSVGANVREAEHAESKADFIHKISIALKEINETNYWIDILIESEDSLVNGLKNLKKEASEILAILVTILKKAKNM